MELIEILFCSKPIAEAPRKTSDRIPGAAALQDEDVTTQKVVVESLRCLWQCISAERQGFISGGVARLMCPVLSTTAIETLEHVFLVPIGVKRNPAQLQHQLCASRRVGVVTIVQTEFIRGYTLILREIGGNMLFHGNNAKTLRFVVQILN